MDIVYQITVFINLTMLAIIVAVYVFTASLYKGAAKITEEEEREVLKRRKTILEKEKNRIVGKLAKTKEDDLQKEMQIEMQSLNSKIVDIEQEMVKVQNKYRALSLKKLVGFPGTIFLISIFLSGIAAYISIIVIWIFSSIFMLIGLYMVYKNLLAVEYFSSVIDLSTLMEQAMDKHVVKNKPIVELELVHQSIGRKILIKSGEIEEIEFWYYLVQGYIGKNVRVRLSCTEELDFPEEKDIEKVDYDYHRMKKPKSFWTEKIDLNANEYQLAKFKIKAPKKPGKYRLAYWVLCDEYTSEEQFFDIQVVK